MTPQERFEHKLRWRPGHAVDTHSDLRSVCKSWVKANLPAHRWYLNVYTDVYGDTFHFECEEDAKRFRDWFNEKT